VRYGFLSDFDLLRDTTDSVRSKPWTRPAYRLAMDKYFKICRAREEIQRLNVEIRRLVTWIDDEDKFLRGKYLSFKESDPSLAIQIDLYRRRRARFDRTHMERLWALAKTPGFTGSVSPGISLERQAELARDMDVEMEEPGEFDRRWNEGREEGWEDQGSGDEGEDAEQEKVSGLLYQLNMLAVDPEAGRTTADLTL
ncbi:hypothetical protein R3P38DRAFT_2532020, partial [Favolaschia claudopus]